jgi:hypothetical protein
MSETSAARKRKRTIEDGKVITNVPPEVGCYVADCADEAGVAPATMARMLIIEGIKARGLSMDDLRQRMRQQEEPATIAV